MQHAARQLQRLVALTAAVAATAAFAKTPEAMPDLPRLTNPAPVSYASALPAKAQSYRIAHEQITADIDGDGQADFANPHRQVRPRRGRLRLGPLRRLAGGRGHEGVDYVAEAGQQVVAPIAGFVTPRRLRLPRQLRLPLRRDHQPAHRLHRPRHVRGPRGQVGQTLALGQPIGRAQSLERRYPNGITNHVHLEIARLDGRQLDAARLIPTSA
jgi:hypothetical protein